MNGVLFLPRHTLQVRMLSAKPLPSHYRGTMTRQGRPTGPKPGFTRTEVVAAALDLGVLDFTLAGVAGRLGVATSALYRTIASRDDLVAACLEELAARVRFTPDPLDWRRNALNQAESLWALLEAHPGLDRLLIGTATTASAFAATITAALEAFIAAGFTPRDAALAVDTIADLVIVTHVEVVSLRRQWSPRDDPPPDLQALPPLFRPEPSWLERGWLDHKLGLVLDGLQVRLERAHADHGDRQDDEHDEGPETTEATRAAATG